ncbi:conserved hypothetical protein [uncultured Desulfobacterium sp.]|uniref:Uncharacterized protein n=1 Tax=uncultured Desulfobacterium sp. TaxID=201089 RepID=A0A445N053_9BACT|nr:conserved hypothetical protein [uncultured Desulfobacterium sp.]
MKFKVVFHIDWGQEENLKMAITNITNLLKIVPREDTDICVLANGPAVKLFQQGRALGYASDIQDLSDKGVHFRVCNNALKHFAVAKDSLVSTCEVVPAGIMELVRLQAEGYAYIKP